MQDPNNLNSESLPAPGKPVSWDRLPPEIFINILKQCPDYPTLRAFLLTCRQFNDAYLLAQNSILKAIAATAYSRRAFELLEFWRPPAYPAVNRERCLTTLLHFAFQLRVVTDFRPPEGTVTLTEEGIECTTQYFDEGEEPPFWISSINFFRLDCEEALLPTPGSFGIKEARRLVRDQRKLCTIAAIVGATCIKERNGNCEGNMCRDRGDLLKEVATYVLNHQSIPGKRLYETYACTTHKHELDLLEVTYLAVLLLQCYYTVCFYNSIEVQGRSPTIFDYSKLIQFTPRERALVREFLKLLDEFNANTLTANIAMTFRARLASAILADWASPVASVTTLLLKYEIVSPEEFSARGYTPGDDNTLGFVYETVKAVRKTAFFTEDAEESMQVRMVLPREWSDRRNQKNEDGTVVGLEFAAFGVLLGSERGQAVAAA